MPTPFVRRATSEDIKYFAEELGFDVPPNTVRAFCGGVSGKLIGIGGLARSQGRWIAFCDLLEEARSYKVTIVRIGKRVMNEAEEMGIRYVYANLDPEEKNAFRWMKKLGFEYHPRSKLMRWTNREER